MKERELSPSWTSRRIECYSRPVAHGNTLLLSLENEDTHTHAYTRCALEATQCFFSVPTTETCLHSHPHLLLLLLLQVSCAINTPLHTAGPATKAVISAVIRNLITVDMSASRLSLQLWNVTKSSFHAAHRFPRPPSVTAGTTSDAGNLETVVLFELGSSLS